MCGSQEQERWRVCEAVMCNIATENTLSDLALFLELASLFVLRPNIVWGIKVQYHDG